MAVAPSIYETRISPSERMRERFLGEVEDARLPAGPSSAALVTEADLAVLPKTAQRYFAFMHVVGRPRTWSFRAHYVGVFRLRPDRTFIPCEVWQYNSALDVARIFHMRLRLGGLVPLMVRDTYLRGHGRMLGRVLDRFSIVDDGSAKIDTGELVTYLDDALMLAPSMLLNPAVSFEEVDDASFDVTLVDHGTRVRGRVFVDERGELVDFSTEDRYGTDPANPGEMVRARWSTPVHGFREEAGRRFALGVQAVWHFPSGDFTYADFRLVEGGLEFDVPASRPA